MEFATKRASIANDVSQAGIRRIAHEDFPLTIDNTKLYR